MKNWNNETRKLGIEKIARRLIDLGGTLGQDIDVRLSYEKTLSELVAACVALEKPTPADPETPAPPIANWSPGSDYDDA